MKILGVDYGAKRIGIAMADTEVNMAFARDPILAAGDPAEDARLVAQLAKAEQSELVVIGLPLLDSGDEGEQCRIARMFGETLRSYGLKIDYCDERCTTLAAEKVLQHLSPEKRKRVADSEAARLILSDYLNRQETRPDGGLSDNA